MCKCGKNSEITEALERHAQRVFQVLGKYGIEEKDFDVALLKNAYTVFGEPFLKDLYNAVYRGNKREISNFTGTEEAEQEDFLVSFLSSDAPQTAALDQSVAAATSLEAPETAVIVSEPKKAQIWGIPSAAFIAIVLLLILVLGMFIYKSK